MGGRTMPTECPHGKILDWGDFGPEPPIPEQCDDCATQAFDVIAERDLLAGIIRKAGGTVGPVWYPHYTGITPAEADAIRRIIDSGEGDR